MKELKNYLIKDALNEAKKLVSPIMARRILEFHLDKSCEWIFLNQNEILENTCVYFELIKDYANGKPFEYITKKVDFFGYEFFIDEGVLIPRVESEILVDKFSQALIDNNLEDKLICEIGIGSGVLSCILAMKFPNLKIIASDISDTAINNAKKNIKKFNLCNQIELRYCSFMDEIIENCQAIISNPPYVANSYPIDNWVKKEPKNAIFGGDVGDEILKKIIKLAKIRNCKILACEIGYDQKESMKNELSKFDFEVEFYKDLANFDRGFIAKQKGV